MLLFWLISTAPFQWMVLMVGEPCSGWASLYGSSMACCYSDTGPFSGPRKHHTSHIFACALPQSRTWKSAFSLSNSAQMGFPPWPLFDSTGRISRSVLRPIGQPLFVIWLVIIRFSSLFLWNRSSSISGTVTSPDISGPAWSRSLLLRSLSRW